jgi:hypothetical protein
MSCAVKLRTQNLVVIPSAKRHLTPVPLVDQHKNQVSLAETGPVISNRTVNTKPLCGCLHHSQEFGNTAAMAEAVAEGLHQAGAEMELTL